MTQEATTDQEAVTALRTDQTLVPIIDEYGPLSLESAEDPFERLVVSLLRQQVSMDAAAAIRERLFDRFEITPAGMLAAEEAALRDVGLSSPKAEYVKTIATAYQDRGYSREYFQGMDDEAVLTELTDIRGVGPWTGKMFLMFALGRPDVFPVEDLAIRRGIETVCGEEMTRSAMRERATAWRPYRSYASLYLWRAYEGE